jgi:hypothetical protein
MIAILSDAIWYAFLVGFALMMLGALMSFFMSTDTPRDTAMPHSAE